MYLSVYTAGVARLTLAVVLLGVPWETALIFGYQIFILIRCLSGSELR